MLLPLLVACYSTTTREPTPPPTVAPAGDKGPSGNAIVGYQRLMQAADIDGSTLAPQARPTALVFFASWCGPCRRELADLSEIRGRYPTLRIIGLNAYEEFRDYSDSQKLRTFLSEHAPWMTEVVSADAGMLADFGMVPRIPTLLVYDASGQVVAEFRRDQRKPPSHEELERAIAAAVRASTLTSR